MNNLLTGLDGITHYRIASPWYKRKRPAHLGPVNYRDICIECREYIPRELKGQFCSDLCAMTHKVSVG